MSIIITYPSAGKMRIECGGDVVELPIPGAGGNMANSEAPPSEQSPRPASTPPVVNPPPVIRSSPKPPPSVAGLITLSSADRYAMVVDVPGSSAEIDEGFKVDMEELERTSFSIYELNRNLAELTRQLGRGIQPRILNVLVRPRANAINVAALSDLIKEPTSGLSGIRLLFNAEVKKL
jgi:hypothetical protein